ncbi:MAG: Gx transporter family protein [Clostridia bacterium]|nr:Gx transporter family protein [Clostridia bacterium]
MSDAKAFSSTKKLTTCALLTALALIFSYIEFLVPLSLGIPGIKIGLANIVIVMALYSLGPGYALVINLVRIALSALLFGNLFSALYALCGGLVSLAVMALLKKTDIFSLTGVSMAGGAAHNIAQLAAAAVIVGSSKVFMYMPVLVLAGMAAGIFNGIVCSLVMRKIK